MEDAEQVQLVRVDPCKRLELFLRIHNKARETLRLIPNQEYFLYPVLFTCQQAASLQRSVTIHVF